MKIGIIILIIIVNVSGVKIAQITGYGPMKQFSFRNTTLNFC